MLLQWYKMENRNKLKGVGAGVAFLFCLFISYNLYPQVKYITNIANSTTGSFIVVIYMWLCLILFNILIPMLIYYSNVKIFNAVIALFLVLIIGSIGPSLITIADFIIGGMSSTGHFYLTTVMMFWTLFIMFLIGIPTVALYSDLGMPV